MFKFAQFGLSRKKRVDAVEAETIASDVARETAKKDRKAARVKVDEDFERFFELINETLEALSAAEVVEEKHKEAE